MNETLQRSGQIFLQLYDKCEIKILTMEFVGDKKKMSSISIKKIQNFRMVILFQKISYCNFVK